MEKYKKEVYRGFILKGNLREAAAYLEKFESQEKKVKKYHSIFLDRNLLKMCKNERVDEILKEFQEYYYQVFWEGLEEASARKELCSRFAQFFRLNAPAPDMPEEEWKKFYDDNIEACLETVVTEEGFHYLGGETQGYLGPYIWEETIPAVFQVELPEGSMEYTVNMLKRFKSRSWMDYISLGKIGAGGWAGEDGRLNCVWKIYKKKLEDPDFQIDFLKHEAQHAMDYKRFENISSRDMEYRAKLVQLIYARKIDTFRWFLEEAGDENINNSHAYASYMIVKNLSKKIFQSSYVKDFTKWKGKQKKIARYALELLKEYPAGTQDKKM